MTIILILIVFVVSTTRIITIMIPTGTCQCDGDNLIIMVQDTIITGICTHTTLGIKVVIMVFIVLCIMAATMVVIITDIMATIAGTRITDIIIIQVIIAIIIQTLTVITNEIMLKVQEDRELQMQYTVVVE